MIKFSIRKQLFNDRFVLVISIILSVILWLFVSISVSPTVTKDISNVPVTISLENSSFNGLSVFGTENYNVQVKIQGKKYITDSVSADDITVTANVGQIVGTGVNTLELSAKATGSREFEITSISPSAVVVYLDYPDTKTVDVDVEYKGATVSKDNYFLEASIPDAYKQVTVTGAKNEVQNVMRAVATADVNATLSSSENFIGNLTLYDASGNIVSLEYSTLSFEQVNITVSVQEQVTLPVTITAQNGPQILPDIKIYRIVNNQQTQVNEITVKGEPSVVEALTNISLGTVDFASLDPYASEWVFNYSLPSIGGVSYPTISSASDAQFKVVISNKGLVSKTFDLNSDQIKITGLDSGKEAVLQTSSLQGITVVSTSSSQLNRLKSENITAYVDVSSLESGSHSCDKITFEISGYPNCWVVVNSNDSVAVVVKIG